MNKWKSFTKELPEEGCYYDVYIKSTHNEHYGLRKIGVLFEGGRFHVCLLCKSEYVSHFMDILPRPVEGEEL